MTSIQPIGTLEFSTRKGCRVALERGVTIIRVKVKSPDNGKWETVKVFYDWDAALDYYNSAPTPRMITTKIRIHHKQYSDNGFIYRVPDPR